jgi:prepilin-type processing-associated H-X9-DG protein
MSEKQTPQTRNTNVGALTAAKKLQFRLVHLLVAMAVVGGCLAILIPLVRRAQHAAHEASCRNNLKQLALAMLNYHDTYRRFPPAYHVDASGKPNHSWRVLVWPFIQAGPIPPYRLSEPWNGPQNATLASSMPHCLRCPDDSSSPKLMTNYVAIVGKGTMWSAPRSMDIADLKDGTSNTLMIVEIAHSDIHWMEPRDLPVEELAAWLDPKHKPQLLGNHVEGGMVAYADGHVEMLSRDVTIERLKALATAAGNDIEQGRASLKP